MKYGATSHNEAVELIQVAPNREKTLDKKQ